MAAFTATNSGNWATTGGAVWDKPGTPTSSDDVYIQPGKTVTITGSAECLNLYCYGPIVLTAGLLVIHGNAELYNTTMTATSSGVYFYNLTGTPMTFKIGVANSQNSKLIASSSTIGRHPAGVGTVSFPANYLNSGQVDATNTSFTYVTSFNVFPVSGSATMFKMTGCRLTNCGNIVTATAGTDNMIFSLVDTSMSSTTTSICFNLNFFYSKSVSGIRLISGCVFDKRGWLSTPTHLSIQNTIFHGAPVEIGQAAMTLFDGNLVEQDIDAQFVCANLTNCYWVVGPSPGNHGPTISKSGGTQRVTGCIFESSWTTSQGDMILVGAPAAATRYEIENNLVIRDFAGTHGSGVIGLQGGANATVVMDHNTLILAGAGSQSLAANETYHGHAGLVESMQGNLCHSVDGGGWILMNTGGASVLANETITVADYNGRSVAMAGSYQFTDAKFGGGATPGAHDVTGDPGFLDDARSMATWDASLGGAGTMVNALIELKKRNDVSGYDSRYSITALMAYVAAGYTPTNTAFRNAHDGDTWIGAFAGPVQAAVEGAGSGIGPILRYGDGWR